MRKKTRAVLRLTEGDKVIILDPKSNYYMKIGTIDHIPRNTYYSEEDYIFTVDICPDFSYSRVELLKVNNSKLAKVLYG